MDKVNDKTVYNMATMPLRKGHFAILAVGSMEQIIGAALSGLVGIVIPMMLLLPTFHGMSSFMQGVMGAAGLLGIAIGSPIIGGLSDRYGYIFYYKLCPLLITVFSLTVYFFPYEAVLVPGLFFIGVGVGGGYALDTDYISEMMPDKWKEFMVGVAKSTSALGFVAIAALCWWIMDKGLKADQWSSLFLILAALGALTFLMRIPCRNTPQWYMEKGEQQQAESAAKYFLGDDVTVAAPEKQTGSGKPTPWIDMFRGANLSKVIFSGIPWACEGVAVYGVGVFLPILIMALGIERTQAEGMTKVIESVELTTIVNSFIVLGFVVGLLLMKRMNHVTMLTGGFVMSALGIGLLLWGYVSHLPLWVSVCAFLIFEIGLNAGPHLITFVIPSQIYGVKDLGAGSGIAAMFGKIGAVAGVFIIPMVLDAGGVEMVLVVCAAIMLLGAVISEVYGRKVMSHHKTK
ncbi:MAG: sugar porter family MFS transporter [Muribaculaceae bacterium]|nr:sugar porter family MFS transporter [Muribaculaceae bacterium]